MKNIPPVIRQFSRTQFSKTIAVLLFSGFLIAMPAATQAVSFVGGPITINDTAHAVPYPSTILVAGLGTSLSSITITITNFSRTSRPDDLDMLLVGPTGASLLFWSDAGGNGGPVGPVTVLVRDGVPIIEPDAGPLVSGSSAPFNYGALETQTDFGLTGLPPLGDPGPTNGGSATFASQFNGTNPNGTWSLYILDDAPVNDGETGSITGWTLDITAVPEPGVWALLVAGAGALAFLRRKRA
jgi:PEP-CTERM motif